MSKDDQTGMAWSLFNIRRVVLLLGAVILGGVAQAHAQSDVLRVVPWSDLQVLDPFTASDPPTATHARMVFDTLFAPDANQKPQPQMVEVHTVSGDRLTHTFTLRDGLLFHDGTPVTAEDCILSIRRWGVRDPFGQLLMASVTTLEPVNHKTFQIVLKAPFPLVLEALARGGIRPPHIMPKRLAETDPFKAITDATGSGPFIFVRNEWVPGSKAVYRRNERYIPRNEAANGLAGAKIAYIDRIEFISFRDPQTAFAALQSGEIDYWPNPPADLIPVLRQTPGIEAATIPAFTQPLIRFNHLQPPFDNPKAREAMLWLIKQDDYLAAIGDAPGLSRTCPSVYGCGTPYETAVGSEALTGHDPTKALAMLKETGWDVTKPIVILHVTDRPSFTAITLTLADAMRRAGIAVQLVSMDAAAMFQRRNNKGPVARGGWNIFPADSSGDILISPVTNAWLAASCDKAFFGWPCDATIEKLKSDFINAESDDQRRTIAAQIQARAYAIASYAPLGHRSQVRAARSTVTGFIRTGDLSDVFWNVRKTADVR